jgi:hypothetical protein
MLRACNKGLNFLRFIFFEERRKKEREGKKEGRRKEKRYLYISDFHVVNQGN